MSHRSHCASNQSTVLDLHSLSSTTSSRNCSNIKDAHSAIYKLLSSLFISIINMLNIYTIACNSDRIIYCLLFLVCHEICLEFHALKDYEMKKGKDIFCAKNIGFKSNSFFLNPALVGFLWCYYLYCYCISFPLSQCHIQCYISHTSFQDTNFNFKLLFIQ